MTLRAGLAALEGRRAEAVAGYRRALAINPNHCSAWLGLGQVLDYRQAIAAFEGDGVAVVPA